MPKEKKSKEEAEESPSSEKKSKEEKVLSKETLLEEQSRIQAKLDLIDQQESERNFLKEIPSRILQLEKKVDIIESALKEVSTHLRLLIEESK